MGRTLCVPFLLTHQQAYAIIAINKPESVSVTAFGLFGLFMQSILNGHHLALRTRFRLLSLTAKIILTYKSLRGVRVQRHAATSPYCGTDLVLRLQSQGTGAGSICCPHSRTAQQFQPCSAALPSGSM